MKDVGINVGLWFHNLSLTSFSGYFIVNGLDSLTLPKSNTHTIVLTFLASINIWFFKSAQKHNSTFNN